MQARRLLLKRAAAVLAAAALLGGPGPGLADEPLEDEALRRRAAAALAPFQRDLKQALQAGLAQGPAEAIDVCRVQAPALAERHTGEGVRVGRTSHRLRNPRNAAPDWVVPILDDWLAQPEARTPRLVSLGSGRVGYAEPIALQPLCLGCHGQTLAPGVAERIAALYPEDRATGFGVGDLRGVFWVELDEGTP